MPKQKIKEPARPITDPVEIRATIHYLAEQKIKKRAGEKMPPFEEFFRDWIEAIQPGPENVWPEGTDNMGAPLTPRVQ
jgi:hypothetical protein